MNALDRRNVLLGAIGAIGVSLLPAMAQAYGHIDITWEDVGSGKSIGRWTRTVGETVVASDFIRYRDRFIHTVEHQADGTGLITDMRVESSGGPIARVSNNVLRRN